MLFPFGLGGSPPRTAGIYHQYVESASTQASGFSFTASLPAGKKNRWVVITLTGATLAPATVFTVTIGGIPCNQVFYGDGSAAYGTIVYQSATPVMQANPQVVITYSPGTYTTGQWRIGVFSYGGLGQFLAGCSYSGAQPTNQTIVSKAGGFLVGAAIGANDGVGCTWTGLTEHWDKGFSTTGTNPGSGASFAGTVDESARTVKYTFASSSGWAGGGAVCSFY